jgi:hypothetical protein
VSVPARPSPHNTSCRGLSSFQEGSRRVLSGASARSQRSAGHVREAGGFDPRGQTRYQPDLRNLQASQQNPQRGFSTVYALQISVTKWQWDFSDDFGYTQIGTRITPDRSRHPGWKASTRSTAGRSAAVGPLARSSQAHGRAQRGVSQSLTVRHRQSSIAWLSQSEVVEQRCER